MGFAFRVEVWVSSKEVGRLEVGFGLGFAFRVEVWVSSKEVGRLELGFGLGSVRR